MQSDPFWSDASPPDRNILALICEAEKARKSYQS